MKDTFEYLLFVFNHFQSKTFQFVRVADLSLHFILFKLCLLQFLIENTYHCILVIETLSVSHKVLFELFHLKVDFFLVNVSLRFLYLKLFNYLAIVDYFHPSLTNLIFNTLVDLLFVS